MYLKVSTGNWHGFLPILLPCSRSLEEGKAMAGREEPKARMGLSQSRKRLQGYRIELCCMSWDHPIIILTPRE